MEHLERLLQARLNLCGALAAPEAPLHMLPEAMGQWGTIQQEMSHRLAQIEESVDILQARLDKLDNHND